MGQLVENINPGFRYTFSTVPFTVVDETEPGLYNWVEGKSARVVVMIDKWGGVRLADQTPVNNLNRLAKEIEHERVRSRRNSIEAQ
jgi:hypothetical protein